MTFCTTRTARERVIAVLVTIAPMLVGAHPVTALAETAAPECAQCPAMATIPAGTFQMGKTIDYGYGEMDGPTHTVTIGQPFELAVHEVTLGEFRAFVKDTGYVSREKCNVYEKETTWFIDKRRNWAAPGFPQEEDHPVVCVSWRDARAYIDWLNRKTGRQYRLPSEAEWEYTASSADLGNSRKGSAITHEVANIGKRECCGGETGGRDVWIHTAPVGSFPADKFGIRDLRGNVWEWQDDCHNVDYQGAPVDGTSRTRCPKPGFHVVRGGSYGDGGDFLSERFRLPGPEDQGYFTVGLRLARSITTPGDATAGEPASAATLAGNSGVAQASGALKPAARPVVSLFEAIRRRDIAAVGDSLSTVAVPEIVYYWGDTVTGRDAILQWHKEWFAEQGWVLAPEKAGHALSDVRLATLTYTVEYIKNPQRKFLILMTCTVVREADAWKVARIQQTLLDGPK